MEEDIEFTQLAIIKAIEILNKHGIDAAGISRFDKYRCQVCKKCCGLPYIDNFPTVKSNVEWFNSLDCPHGDHKFRV